MCDIEKVGQQLFERVDRLGGEYLLKDQWARPAQGSMKK